MRGALMTATVAIAVALLGATGAAAASPSASAQTGASGRGHIDRFNEGATHSPEVESSLAGHAVTPAAAARSMSAALAKPAALASTASAVEGIDVASFRGALASALAGFLARGISSGDLLAGSMVKAYAVSKTDRIKVEDAYSAAHADAVISASPAIPLSCLAALYAVWASRDARVAAAAALVSFVLLLLAEACYALLMQRTPGRGAVKAAAWLLSVAGLMRRRAARLESWGEGLLLSLGRGVRESFAGVWPMFVGLMISSLVWAFGMLRLWMAFRAFAVPVDFIQAAAAYALLSLAFAYPLLPGSLGLWEWAATLGFSAFGVPFEAAAAAVILDRIVSYWATMFLSLLSSRISGLDVGDLLSSEQS
jgi:uncharacterized protein (TIRG00374 family)